MCHRVCLLLSSLALLAPPVLADEPVLFDRITLAAEAEQSVDNDRMTATLFVEREGGDAAGPADEVNQTMSWALAQAKAVPDVEVSTPGYRTYPVYQSGRISAWRVRQSLRLESTEGAAMSELLGTLQTRMGMQGIGFGLSDTRRLEAEQAMISAALKRFGERAAQVARELGRGGYRIVTLQVDTGGTRPPQPRMAMAMEKARVAPPAVAGGDSEVRVRVSGTIQLKD